MRLNYAQNSLAVVNNLEPTMQNHASLLPLILSLSILPCLSQSKLPDTCMCLFSHFSRGLPSSGLIILQISLSFWHSDWRMQHIFLLRCKKVAIKLSWNRNINKLPEKWIVGNLPSYMILTEGSYLPKRRDVWIISRG